MDWQQEKVTVGVFLAMLHELADNHNKIQTVIKLREYYRDSGGYISLPDAKSMADSMAEAINQFPYNEREVKTEVVYETHPKHRPAATWMEEAVERGCIARYDRSNDGVCFTLYDSNGQTVVTGVGGDTVSALYDAWYHYTINKLIESGLLYSEACRVLDAESWAK